MTTLGDALSARPVFKRKTISDADYAASSSDYQIAYTSLSAARTVTLTPAGSALSPKIWIIKDESGSAGNYSINLASTSGTFDGLASTKINTAYGSKMFMDNGTNFYMYGSFLPSVNASASLQKADGSGGFMNAVSGTDFASTGSIPTAVSQLTNDSGYTTSSSVSASYVPKTTTVNSHALSGNVSVTASDLSLGNVVNLDTSTASNITDSTNKRFMTDANKTILNNTSGTNTGDQVIPSVTRTTSTLSLSLVGTGATGTQISSTKDSSISCTVSTSTTSTIGGPSTSIVALKICSTNNATEGIWTTIATLENDQTITLAVALQSIQTLKGQLCADIPAGWYAKLVNSGTGTHSETFLSGQQTIYG